MKRPKPHWHLWSTRENGLLLIPRPVKRLPKGAEVCGNGDWAELHDEKGVERVFVNLRDAGAVESQRKVA